jgi:hypothetical protein
VISTEAIDIGGLVVGEKRLFCGLSPVNNRPYAQLITGLET